MCAGNGEQLPRPARYCDGSGPVTGNAPALPQACVVSSTPFHRKLLMAPDTAF
jgi:hypothetical protein